MNGPVLTLTLKDRSIDGGGERPESSAAATTEGVVVPKRLHRRDSDQHWSDLTCLRPQLLWEVASLQPPLPYWVPTLKQLKARVAYSYADLRRQPSRIEGTAKFATSLGELIVQPSYDVATKQTTCLMEASRGLDWVLARFRQGPTQILPSLDTLRCSAVLNLPYVSVSSIRVTPSLDVPTRDATCQIEAITGGFGRTRAVFNLERRNPTLSIIHALDNRHTIAPTVNLLNAKIVYQWNVLLGRTGASSIRTKVDPTSAIDVTWSDQSDIDGGSWIADVRIPLNEPTSVAKLISSNFRLRRKFLF